MLYQRAFALLANPDSDALVRQTLRNADEENYPRSEGGLG